MKPITLGKWRPDEGKAYQTVKVRDIPGITAKIYKSVSAKGYTSYVLSYSLMGKRKLETFADSAKAKAAGEDAITKIANSEQQVLELRNGDAFEYLRAKEIMSALPGMKLDAVCTLAVEVIGALKGTGTPLEAAREFARRHGAVAAKATVAEAVKEMIQQEEKEQDGKRKVAWVKLLKAHLQNKFAVDINKRVDQVEPADLNAWLSGLDCAERTKKNARDVLQHFFKWCRGRGYLPKDADPLADVQDYRKRKRGKIHILTPDELGKLLNKTEPELLPYIALRAFAGLRDSEASAIEWQHIDLNGGWIEITDEVAKQSDDEEGLRRLIPVRDCLKDWIGEHAKQSGRVCPFDNTPKQIAALCETAGVTWKRNCLRHSYISYAVAESGDIPLVATHSGNSQAIIRQHYLRVVKPEAAKEWFNVVPKKA
jgi:integrase